MKTDFTILIADRNPHVRDFLLREMKAEGYQVHLAKSGREVLDRVYQQGPLDLLILDPNLPDAGDLPLLEKLQARIPSLPIVLHTFLSGDEGVSHLFNLFVFVEKNGYNMDLLKEAVLATLRKAYPHRFG